MHKERENIRLVSSDLNGTLVHQHTMMDMIRVYFPQQPERYEKADEAFTKQTAGLLSMKEAFAIAGPLTKGLSLRNAIEYVTEEMRFLEGFEDLITTLSKHGKQFVINSTGYSVTTEATKALYGSEKIYGVICNRLIFAWDGDPRRPIDEAHLCQLVRNYFLGKKEETLYDETLATGEVELGIQDEGEKATLLFTIAERLKIPRTAIAHIGDTMGDSAGIYEIARNGGLGIAFNYNEALKQYLEPVLEQEKILGEIILVEPKSKRADLRKLLKMLVPGPK
ncbi:MAG: haloacid dehalogenase-like hydrolase [Pseudomonadota bacterium]